jgi:AcrR family transcriptional regulator
MNVTAVTEAAVLALAGEHPEFGKVRAARELNKRGIKVSPSAVHLVWKEHGLSSTYERLLKRRREASDSGALSESQMSLLRRKRTMRRVVDTSSSNSEVPAGTSRRDALISAAARILGEVGYERATLQMICNAAGILATSLYHHFKSKEDLFIAAHEAGFRQLNDAVNAAVAQHTDPWARLEAACAAHIRLVVAGPDVSLVSGASPFLSAPQALQRRLNRDRYAYEARFRLLVEALDLPAEVDRSLLRLYILGALNWTRLWYQPGKRDPKSLAHQLVQVILRKGLDRKR